MRSGTTKSCDPESQEERDKFLQGRSPMPMISYEQYSVVQNSLKFSLEFFYAMTAAEEVDCDAC